MKSQGTTDRLEGAVDQPLPPGGDGGTRDAVARAVLEHGPVSAVDVAGALGLSPAAVRRHLDALLAEGQVSTRSAPRLGRRGRGRPAKRYLLTETGRARFGHAYDDLAVAALRFLADRGGEEAVRSFAERRVSELVARHRPSVMARTDPAARAEALASALSAQGYAASAQQVGAGAQLCQHHCPVAHVAAEFPQLCEAETQAFADLLGIHVQRLATIARGDAVCTTHVPGEAGAMRTSPGEAGAMRTSPGEAGAMRTSPGEAGAMRTSPGEAGAMRTIPNDPTTEPDGGVPA